MTEARPVPHLRLFFDTDALLAGAASTRGAAHLLLRLAELGLIDVATSDYVRDEAVRNVGRKLPAAAPTLAALLDQVVSVTPTPPTDRVDVVFGVHPKDVPVWAAFRRSDAHFLVTFNLRDYPAVPYVVTPGQVVVLIRNALAGLSI